VIFVTFLIFLDILGSAKKTKNNSYRVTKPQDRHNVQKCDIVPFENVAKYLTFSDLSYKATFNFYVWIRLRMTLRVRDSLHVCTRWV